MSEYIVSDTEPSVMSALIPSVPEEEPDDILEVPMPPALRDALNVHAECNGTFWKYMHESQEAHSALMIRIEERLLAALEASAPPQPSPPGQQVVLTPYRVTVHGIAPNGFPVTFALEAASLAEGSAALMKLVFDMVAQGFSVPDHVPF